jgi:hypothetical protein
MGVEPCMVSLVRRVFPKDVNHRKGDLIFMNFGVRNFTLKNNKNKKL